MSEVYKPIIQSGPYTIEWARRRGVTPDRLDPAELISAEPETRENGGEVVSALIRENLEICGENGRVSLPTYPVKRLLPENPEKYRAVVAALHEKYLDAVEECYGTKNPRALVRLFSVGFGPDGYVPREGETEEDISAYTKPQLAAAKEYGYRPIVEATTSLKRLKTAWQDAHECGIEEIDIGLAFDSHGHLAADASTLGQLIDYVESNPGGYSTKVTLGANCGSLTGIEKAATAYPGTLRFAYANNVDIEDIDHLGNLGNGTVHHHKDPVTPEEFARVAQKHRFPVVSLCCGFCADDLRKLRQLISERGEASEK